jgi:hypothetical protein
MSAYRTSDGDQKSVAKKPNNKKGYKHADGEFWFASSDYNGTAVAVEPPAVPRLYKVLRADGRAPIAGNQLQYDLPTVAADGTVTPGKWKSITGPIKLCERGFHAFDARQWQSWLGSGARLFEVEFDGAVGKTHDKWIGARMRIVREIPYAVVQARAAKLDRHASAPTREETMTAAALQARDVARNEFNGQQARASFAKAKSKLGTLAEEAEKAVVAGQGSWSLFRTRVTNAVISLETAQGEIENAVKLLGGKVPPELATMLKEARAIKSALPTLTWLSTQEPWNPEQVTYAAVNRVGSTWYADYVKRTEKAVEEAREAAGKKYDTEGVKVTTFDTIVDDVLGGETAPVAAEAKPAKPAVKVTKTAITIRTRRGR